MHLLPTIISASLFCVFPYVSYSGVELYSGTMDVVSVSGKACAGLKGKHAVSLIIRQGEDGSDVDGYFWGQGITTGKFSGRNQSRLAVSYPYHDESRATGHFLNITTSDKGLIAELRDRHIERNVEDCNFDLARMTLSRAGTGDQAEASLKPMADLFDAQLKRSEAFSLAREGHYDTALPLYEKALSLAEPATGGSENLLAPYITGLANAYVKLGRFDEFNQLYDERIDSIKDQGVRAIFTGYRVSSLLNTGRAFLARDEYSAALESFQKASSLMPKSKEIIAAVMSVYIRTSDFDGAIVFLERALKNVDSENVRQDVQGALGYVYLLRSKKFEKDGKETAAEADLKNAEAHDPYSVQYLIALARLRHKAGNLTEAEKLLQKGLDRFHQESARQEIIASRDKMRQIEAILKKLRRAGG